MTVRVGASDTELQGVVSHPRYFEWFQKARVEYLRERGLFAIDTDGTLVIGGERIRQVLVNVSCRFRSPARFDDLLEITTAVSSVGENSATFAHEVFNTSRDDALVLTSEAVMVYLDPVTQSKTAVPKGLRPLS